MVVLRTLLNSEKPMNNKELRDKINTAYENTVGVEGVGTGYESFVDELLTLIQQVRVERLTYIKKPVPHRVQKGTMTEQNTEQLKKDLNQYLIERKDRH